MKDTLSFVKEFARGWSDQCLPVSQQLHIVSDIFADLEREAERQMLF